MNEDKKNKDMSEQEQKARAMDTTEAIKARRGEILKKRIRLPKRPGRKNPFNKRKLLYGSISIVLVIGVIATIIVANLGVSYLTDRFDIKADISPTSKYEISDSTKIILQNLSEPIYVHILLSEDNVINSEYYSVANEFLKRYRTLSDGMLSIDYVDIYKNPSFLDGYKDTNDDVTAGSFIIESSKRYKILKLADLYDLVTTLDQDTYKTDQYVSGINADQTLASAINYVVSSDLPTVVFMTGHDESYGDSFVDLFTNSNYGYAECNLLFDDIPNDAAIVVIGPPQMDYTPEEIDKLDNYLTQVGGNVMMFTSVNDISTPNLDEYLSEWGIGVSDQWVLDSSRALYSQTGIVADVVDDAVSDDMTISNTTYIMMPNSRALTQLWESSNNHTTSVQLQSSATSYAKDYSASASQITSYTQADEDAVGPFALGMASTYSTYMNGILTSSKMLVFSSSSMATDSLFEISSLANKEYLIKAINYLNPAKDAVNIESKDYTSDKITILSSQAKVVFWVLVVVVPVIILGFGVYVWLRRRHK